MKTIIHILCILVLATFVSSLSILDVEKSLEDKWKSFKKTHNKKYLNANDELERRLIWQANHKFIEKHNEEANRGIHTFFLGMNKFGDLENSEFIKKYTGYKPSKKTDNIKSTNIVDRSRVKRSIDFDFEIPEKFDWREEGFETPVKDQGECASSWAYAAVAVLEGQYFRATGESVSFSEQSLIDAHSKKQGNNGCEGGSIEDAFNYVIANNGIATEASYPYIDVNISFFKEMNQNDQMFDISLTSDLNEFVDTKINVANPEFLVAKVGPIPAVMEVDLRMQFYSSGVYNQVYNPACSTIGVTNFGHALTIVGYHNCKSNCEVPYWVIKNSWGPRWGQSGYMKIEKENNDCLP